MEAQCWLAAPAKPARNAELPCCLWSGGRCLGRRTCCQSNTTTKLPKVSDGTCLTTVWGAADGPNEPDVPQPSMGKLHLPAAERVWAAGHGMDRTSMRPRKGVAKLHMGINKVLFLESAQRHLLESAQRHQSKKHKAYYFNVDSKSNIICFFSNAFSNITMAKARKTDGGKPDHQPLK